MCCCRWRSVRRNLSWTARACCGSAPISRSVRARQAASLPRGPNLSCRGVAPNCDYPGPIDCTPGVLQLADGMSTNGQTRLMLLDFWLAERETVLAVRNCCYGHDAPSAKDIMLFVSLALGCRPVSAQVRDLTMGRRPYWRIHRELSLGSWGKRASDAGKGGNAKVEGRAWPLPATRIMCLLFTTRCSFNGSAQWGRRY